MSRGPAIALGAVYLALLLAAAAAQEGGIGRPVDWSSRHLVHGNMTAATLDHKDPRAVYDWDIRNRAAQSGQAVRPRKSKTRIDWNFPLGAGTVPQSMSPAKYSFDAGTGVLTTANCTSDYLVYGLNVTGSGSQPNIVRFINIYSGSAGLCGSASIAASPNGAVRTSNVVTITTITPHAFTVGMLVAIAGVTNTTFNGSFTVTSVPSATTFTYAQAATNAASGSGTASFGTASVKSAYNITTQTGGLVQTSPALSLDGTKAAFIESTSPATASVFHVLAWGTTGSNGSFSNTSNLYTTAVPGTNNNAVMTNLSYSTASTTYSSPWIDYRSTADNAYFGDDNGNLYKTTCAFYCASGVSPALASGWPVTVAGAGVKMGPPVYDTVSNNVFVGGSNGNLYLVDLSLCPGTNCTVAGGGIKSIQVGSANTFGGVIDGPLVDPTFQTVFAFAGDDGGGAGAAVQTNTSFTMTPLKLSMGTTAFFNIYAGALDDAYFQNAVGGSTVGGNLFACGQLGGSGQPDLYWIPFTKNTGNLSTSNPPIFNAIAASKVNVPGNPGIGCTPLTEFKNGTTDRLFFSQSSLPKSKCTTNSAANTGCMMMYDITAPSSTIGNAPIAAATENNGTSGIIVDNASPSPQAASVYFADQQKATTTCSTGAGVTQPSFCAVKLTQTLLQ